MLAWVAPLVLRRGDQPSCGRENLLALHARQAVAPVTPGAPGMKPQIDRRTFLSTGFTFELVGRHGWFDEMASP